jgi:hypothetical protein
MGLKLYCNRYGHFKDPIVCSVVCQYRTRCHDFAIYYDANRVAVDAVVAEYFTARNEPARKKRNANIAAVAVPVQLRNLISLEVKREMSVNSYMWVNKEGIAELLELEDIIKRAEKGLQPKAIYKVAQEMELKFQLVPRKRIEKAKRIVAVDAERAAARRKGPRPVETEDIEQLEAVPENETSAPLRRPRGRVAKAAGER